MELHKVLTWVVRMQGERGSLRDLQRYHRGLPQPIVIEEEREDVVNVVEVVKEDDAVVIEEQNVIRFKFFPLDQIKLGDIEIQGSLKKYIIVL